MPIQNSEHQGFDPATTRKPMRRVRGMRRSMTVATSRRRKTPSSTVSELPFVYVQWSQTVTLFPVIEACKLVALQTSFAFMQQA